MERFTHDGHDSYVFETLPDIVKELIKGCQIYMEHQQANPISILESMKGQLADIALFKFWFYDRIDYTGNKNFYIYI